MRKLLIALACAGALGFVDSARAQVYPSRPITIVVPFAAGGPIAAAQLSILWQRLSSANELRNLAATMARMSCATIVGDVWSDHA